MKNMNINSLTRLALLLAIIAMTQMFGRMIPDSNFVVGSIINACLLIAVSTVGLRGAGVLSILAPFTSLISNHAPIAAALLPFAPAIAVANFAYCLVFFYLMKKNKIAGVALGSLVKFGLLFGAINVFLNIMSFPKFAAVLLMLFSWPQLVTALIGGAIALTVIRRLEKINFNK